MASPAAHRVARQIIKRLEALGWTVTVTKSRHYKALSPDGVSVVHFGAATHPSAVQNVLQHLRRAGADIRLKGN